MNFDNKVRYVPNRGDDDPLWDYLANVIYNSSNDPWTLASWEKALSKVTSSDLTVRQYMDELNENNVTLLD